ncbi:hypothetical protein D9611_011403 [Ephemerocybe angulata]|uniref:Uncharacterized protein n=1 Tax=Ephemerocybe angulata TaxID=980116 RepID=A0A8H5CDC5_9AGAR|nr:hypothetical protein D9611_011403 [Tulosesus angulatus]
MEPLRDLSILKNWDKYVPSTTGYLSTPLDDPFDTDVCDLLECLERMKPKGAIAGAHILTEAPYPGIGIEDKILPLPISEQDFEFLLESEDAIAFGDDEVTFDWDKIKINNASWSHAIDKGTSATMQAAGIDRELWKKYIFGGLTIIDLKAGGAHLLDLRSMSNRHLATVFVILPSARSSATFEARHQGLTFAHDLTTSALFAPHFLICYPGMESAELRTQGRMAYLMYRLYAGDDSDPLPPLLDDLSPGPRSDVAAAFAGWAHALANDLTGDGIPTGPILYHLDAVYKGKYCLTSWIPKGLLAKQEPNGVQLVLGLSSRTLLFQRSE